MASTAKSAPRVDDRIIQDIKDALTLSSVIGRSVTLKRNGRAFVGLSPFNKEKTPSFHVLDDRQFFHCFSSGKSGDVFTYLMLQERISFPEALERAASMAGISLPAPTEAEAAARQKIQRVYDVLALSRDWFLRQLQTESEVNVDARSYLDGRGLPDDIRRQFCLGFSPKHGGLLTHLSEAGYTADEAIAAGLVFRGSGGRTIERFRNRVIFPIEDARGRVVSFGGRAIETGEKAKYLNGPETSVYSKGQVLFGLMRAVAMLSPSLPQLVVVEGYLDVIACQRAGVPGVAPLGTALTETHVRLLWQKCDEPILCFDADSAGVSASMRVVPKILPLLKAGRSFRICYLKGAKDPDELFAAAGSDGLLSALSDTVPFYELAFRYACGSEPIDTPERKQGARSRLREAAALIEDDELRGLYIEAFEDLFQRNHGQYQSSPVGGEISSRNRSLVVYGVPEKALCGDPQPMSCALLVGALDHPHWLHPHVDELHASSFGDPALREICDEILCYYDNLPERPDWHTLPKLDDVLVQSGFSEIIRLARSSALPVPFLSDRVSDQRRQEMWIRGYSAVNRLAWLKAMFANDDGELQIMLGSKSYYELRFEADSLETSLANGYVWEKVK